MAIRQMVDFFKLRDYLTQRQDQYEGLAGSAALSALELKGNILPKKIEEREKEEANALRYSTIAKEVRSVNDLIRRMVQAIDVPEKDA
jgi:hypothetical protein